MLQEDNKMKGIKSEKESVEKFEKSIDSLGWVFGLESVSALIEELGLSEKIPLVHVAGTNGKGSVCMMIAAILAEAGLKVGLFTSPAIFDPLEVISVNGTNISEKEYDADMLLIKEACERVTARGISHPTAFEVKTALAYYYFNKVECDAIVFETGLGGSLDATNFVKRPVCSCITEIGMDHTDILGDTIEKIAAAKAGIIKKDSVVFENVTDEAAKRVIEKAAEKKGASYYDVSKLEISPELYENVNSPVLCQKRNARLAAVASSYVLKNIFGLDSDKARLAVSEGIKHTVFKGRFEKISQDPEIYIDGGHNVQAVKGLYNTLKSVGNEEEKWILVTGMLRDKDHRSAVDIMSGVAGRVYTVTVPNPRTLDGKELAEEYAAHNVDAIYCETSDLAIKEATAFAKQTDSRILCFGSFYLLSQLKRAVEEMKL